MTKTAPTIDRARIRELLSSGRTVQQVADITGWPRTSVLTVIRNTKGWLHSQATDTVYCPTGNDDGDQSEADADTKVDRLLAQAAGVDDNTVRRDLAKAWTAITQLRESVTTVTEKRAAEREIAELEEKLAEAKARAKQLGVKPRRTARSDRPSDKDVRAWAAERGIEVNAHGRVPQTVTDQYMAELRTAS